MGRICRGRHTRKQMGFRDALSRYKNAGCNTLVVGELPPVVKRHLTRRQFGDVDARRYRVLGLADAVDADARFPSGLSKHARRERTRVVEYDDLDRGAAVATPTESVGMGTATPTNDALADFQRDALSDFQNDLQTAVDGMDERGENGLEVAELRLAVDSLAPLVEDHAIESVESFVRTTTETVREYRGMGQLFLPLPRCHELTERLECHFEIVQTIYTDGSGFVQEWDLREYDLQQAIPLQVNDRELD